MSARDRERPHAQTGVGDLASMPLEPDVGLREVEWLAADVERASLFVARPVLEDGSRPPSRSPTLAWMPRLAATARRERVAFEHDGSTLRTQVAFGMPVDLYGAGLAAGPLRRNGRAQVFWNTDAWRYGEHSPSLYSSHPCALALARDGSATMVIADCASRGSIAFATDGVELAFERAAFDVALLRAPSLDELYRAFSALIGRAPLPPAWSLGYHQCRWSYATQREVLAIARSFRRRRIPCDAIWLDIDHMDRLRPLTFDRASFQDPRAMLAKLRALSLRCVAIVDPGVPIARDHALSREGLDGRHFVLDARGKPAVGRVWPGRCRFPDFRRAATRRWFGERCASFASVGLDGLWCDMNEPALFRTPTKTLPESARHRGDGGGGSHLELHNLYGHSMAQAVRTGLERARPAERPFVLTRSAHLATARFAAQWTGDNQSTFTDLRWSIAMCLNLTLSGQPHCGPDLGGFDGDPSPELFARWLELGAFLPFMRGHGSKHSRRKEPWSFGRAVEARVRRAIELRMRLLPYLYTLAHDAHARGAPIVRPTFWSDPRDLRLRAIDDQFLLGDALLVAPALEAGERSRRVVLPRGGWYRWNGSREFVRSRELDADVARGPALFVRAGSILPIAAVARDAQAALEGDLELWAFADRRGRARGCLVEDDGRCREPSDATTRVSELELDGRRDRPTLIEVARGRFEPARPGWRVRVHRGAIGATTARLVLDRAPSSGPIGARARRR